MSELPVIPPGFKFEADPPQPAPRIPVLPPGFRFAPDPGFNDIRPAPEEAEPESAPAPPTYRRGPGPDEPLPPNMRQPGIHPPQPAPEPPDWATRNIISPVREYLTAPKLKDKTGQAYPEIAEMDMEALPGWKQAGVAWAHILESDPEGRAKAFASRIPGTAIRKDKAGNVFIDISHDQQQALKLKPTYAMNQPGPSWADLMDTSIFGTKAALMGAAIGAPKTAIGMAARTGAATFAETAAEEIGSKALGTGRVPDARNWITSAGLGAIIGAGGRGLWQGLQKMLGTGALTDSTGVLTSGAASFLKRHGVKPDTLTQDAINHLKILLPTADNPTEAVRLAMFRAERVTALKPDITQDPKHRAAAYRMEKGGTPGVAMTDDEAAVRTIRRETQPNELANRAASIIEKMTGRRPEVAASSETARAAITAQRGEDIAHTQKVLKALKERDAAAVRRLYKPANEGDLQFAPDKVRGLSLEMQKIKEGTNVASARDIADELATMIKAANEGGVVPMAYRDMELKIRQRISELGASPDGRDRMVAGKLRRAYDDWEKSLEPTDFVKGDPAAIASVRAGRQRRAEMATKFEDDALIEDLLTVHRMPTPGGKAVYELEMHPSEIAEKITSKVMARGGDAMANTVIRLKRILGEKSEAYQAVRREVLVRMFEKGSLTLEADVAAMLRNNPKLANELFSKAEQRELMQHGRVAKMAGGTETGVENKSATTHELMRRIPSNLADVRTIGGAIGALRPVAGNVMRGEPSMSPRWMMNATPEPLLPPRIIGGAAAQAGQDPEAMRRAETAAGLVGRGFTELDQYVRALRAQPRSGR